MPTSTIKLVVFLCIAGSLYASEKHEELFPQCEGDKCDGSHDVPDPTMTETIYQFSAKTVDGQEVSLEKYKGKVVLIVNVASQCGLTESNYRQLKETFDKYHTKGLEVALFPCNQFGGQEPGSEDEIKSFIAEYGFRPDIYAKVKVNGDDAHPLYKFLKEKQGGTLVDAIKWNFTKFLVDREGRPIKRYAPTTEPKDIHADIETAL
ncbi:glutathione peroxidase [Aphelenchoides avenae]|nr:glutathione peroxidase [Aphelenchus avenae]